MEGGGMTTTLSGRGPRFPEATATEAKGLARVARTDTERLHARAKAKLALGPEFRIENIKALERSIRRVRAAHPEAVVLRPEGESRLRVSIVIPTVFGGRLGAMTSMFRHRRRRGTMQIHCSVWLTEHAHQRAAQRLLP